MKICLICNEYPPGPHGGIGTFTQMFARQLAQDGHQVRVIGAYPSEFPGPNYENDGPVQVWRQRLGRFRLSWVAARYRLYQTVASLCRAGNVDLVEAPDYQGWAALWPSLDVPVVVRAHGSGGYFAAELNRTIRPRDFWLERKSLERADFWVSCSRYTAQRTKHVFNLPAEANAVLHNPVRISSLGDAPRSRHDVIFTGTLTAKKGVLSLLASWPQVMRSHPQAVLHLYGKDSRDENGSVQARLQAMLDSTTQRASVRFHGHQPRNAVLEAIQRVRLAVFPSYAEAFALAPLETMACGCPTIYSQRGSGPELIEHGVHGLLVDPDRPSDIAEAILALLENDDLARRLGEAGRQRTLDHFEVGHLARRNVDFYQMCIDRFSSSRRHLASHATA